VPDSSTSKFRKIGPLSHSLFTSEEARGEGYSSQNTRHSNELDTKLIRKSDVELIQVILILYPIAIIQGV